MVGLGRQAWCSVVGGVLEWGKTWQVRLGHQLPAWEACELSKGRLALVIVPGLSNEAWCFYRVGLAQVAQYSRAGPD